MDVKEVSLIVREYFDSIKKIKFLFDVGNVEFKREEGVWTVECEIVNLFDEEPIFYEITVQDETGDILDVRKVE